MKRTLQELPNRIATWARVFSRNASGFISDSLHFVLCFGRKEHHRGVGFSYPISDQLNSGPHPDVNLS